jgi:hypothetical protein
MNCNHILVGVNILANFNHIKIKLSIGIRLLKTNEVIAKTCWTLSLKY